MKIWNFKTTHDEIVHDQHLYEQNKKQGRIVALGYFDGVHRGHREILQAAGEIARLSGALPAVHSFSTPPVSKMKRQDKEGFLLTNESEKLALFEENGIREVFLTPFQKEVERLSPEAFVDLYAKRLFGVIGIVAGDDYRFGKNRAGDMCFLKKWGGENCVKIVSVPPLCVEGAAISSTWIRTLLRSGEAEKAAALMGRPISYENKVEKGFQVGRQLQFPTANMRVDPEKIIPKQGVYASVFVVEGRAFSSISNIGVRPTLNREDEGVLLETTLLDCEMELYEKTARVYLLKFIRPEQKFASLEDLAKQVQNDFFAVRKYHEEHKAIRISFGL